MDERTVLYAGQLHSILTVVKDSPHLLENQKFSDALETVIRQAPVDVLLVSTVRLVELRGKLDNFGHS